MGKEKEVIIMTMINKRMCKCGHSENNHGQEVCFKNCNREGKVISKQCYSECEYETKTKKCNCQRFRLKVK